MSTQTIPTAQYKEIFKEITEFVDKYTHSNIDNNANVIITTFDVNHNRWFQIVPFMKDCNKYVEALMLIVLRLTICRHMNPYKSCRHTYQNLKVTTCHNMHTVKTYIILLALRGIILEKYMTNLL